MSEPTAVAPGCDAPEPRPLYVLRLDDGGMPVYGCRCMVCARCNHHTGNTTQGHWWVFCTVTGRRESSHFCCPDDCELLADGPRRLRPGPGERALIPPVHPMLSDVVAPHLPRVGHRADHDEGAS